MSNPEKPLSNTACRASPSFSGNDYGKQWIQYSRKGIALYQGIHFLKLLDVLVYIVSHLEGLVGSG